MASSPPFEIVDQLVSRFGTYNLSKMNLNDLLRGTLLISRKRSYEKKRDFEWSERTFTGLRFDRFGSMSIVTNRRNLKERERKNFLPYFFRQYWNKRKRFRRRFDHCSQNGAHVSRRFHQNSSSAITCRRGGKGDKGERGESWRNSRKFRIGNRDSVHREEGASEGKRREFSNRRRTKIICGIRFPRGNRVSIGSCEIPGVLTRAIYHARSVFAYVVKGPCVAYALGHIGVVECLLKFACLRILRTRAHAPLLSLSLSHPSISVSLYFSFRAYV